MRLRLRVPIALKDAVPGQFFMVRNPYGTDPLIGRAFALYDYGADEEGDWLEVVYVIKGKLTHSLIELGVGHRVTLWGPLGNGFSTAPTDHLILVAGGIGQTPFLTLIKEAVGQAAYGSPNRPSNYAKRVSLCYGARTKDYLAGVEEFEKAGAVVHIATEDGSIGPPQRVTAVLEELLDQATPDQSARIVCCGPEPMMEAVSLIAAHRGITCQVSLETPMACGIGICFTCVAKIGSADDWDYKRTCVEGPVFDACDVQWH